MYSVHGALYYTRYYLVSCSNYSYLKYMQALLVYVLIIVVCVCVCVCVCVYIK